LSVGIMYEVYMLIIMSQDPNYLVFVYPVFFM